MHGKGEARKDVAHAVLQVWPTEESGSPHAALGAGETARPAPAARMAVAPTPGKQLRLAWPPRSTPRRRSRRLAGASPRRLRQPGADGRRTQRQNGRCLPQSRWPERGSAQIAGTWAPVLARAWPVPAANDKVAVRKMHGETGPTAQCFATCLPDCGTSARSHSLRSPAERLSAHGGLGVLVVHLL